MISRRFHPGLAASLALLLAVTASAQKKDPAPTALTDALKKVSGRYDRTEARIQLIVGRRLDPQPLPASLPNPFYRGVEPSELETLPEATQGELAPAAPDISDADTLARVAPTLRITGLVLLNQQLHVTINSTTCKAGDVIAVGGKDTPIFIQVRHVTNNQLTLALNDAELTIPLKL